MQKKCHMLELYKDCLNNGKSLKSGDILNFNINQDERSVQNKNLKYFLDILKEMTNAANEKGISSVFILNNYNFIIVPLNQMKNEKLQDNIKNLSTDMVKNKSSDNKLYWGKID